MRIYQRVFILVQFWLGWFGFVIWHVSQQEPQSEGPQGAVLLLFLVRKNKG